jgi:hypothetical protein
MEAWHHLLHLRKKQIDEDDGSLSSFTLEKKKKKR